MLLSPAEAYEPSFRGMVNALRARTVVVLLVLSQEVERTGNSAAKQISLFCSRWRGESPQATSMLQLPPKLFPETSMYFQPLKHRNDSLYGESYEETSMYSIVWKLTFEPLNYQWDISSAETAAATVQYLAS